MLPHTEYIHYLIHRQAKQPEPEVHKVLQDVSNEVNFIKMAFKYTVFCTDRWPWKIFSFFIWHRGLLATSGKLYKRIAELNVDMNFFFFKLWQLCWCFLWWQEAVSNVPSWYFQKKYALIICSVWVKVTFQQGVIQEVLLERSHVFEKPFPKLIFGNTSIVIHSCSQNRCKCCIKTVRSVDINLQREFPDLCKHLPNSFCGIWTHWLKIQKYSTFILQGHLMDMREHENLPAKFQGKLLHDLLGGSGKWIAW